MRVVAGELKGRQLRALPGRRTRPTSERVREALFSVLGQRVEGAWVLDLFAGTGALAIEALSRGARGAVLVEQSAGAAGVIRENLRALELEDVASVRRTKAETYLRTSARNDGPFDLVFLDPPYALGVGALAGMLARLAQGLLSEGAVVVVEAAARAEAPPWPAGLAPERARRYGDTALHLAAFRARLASEPCREGGRDG
jgi:16S rRNA (guanine966-N2)-methyltransferase